MKITTEVVGAFGARFRGNIEKLRASAIERALRKRPRGNKGRSRTGFQPSVSVRHDDPRLKRK